MTSPQLLCDPNWNLLTLFAPNQHLVLAPQKENELPLEEAKELLVKWTFNIFIDNIQGLCIDMPGTDNAIWLERAPILAIHACSRSLSKSEPIPWKDMMAALSKLNAKIAGLMEKKMFLRWHLNFRSLVISLPENEHITWTNSICMMISNKETTKNK